MERPMLIEQDIRIKAYEIDAMGIVSNINYVKWFEDLRHAFLDKYMPYEEILNEGKSPILMKTEVNYSTPLTIFHKPRGRSWVSRMGRTKWVIDFEIFTDEGIHCSGRQTGCIYDMEKKAPTVFPDDFIAAYEKEKAAPLEL